MLLRCFKVIWCFRVDLGISTMVDISLREEWRQCVVIVGGNFANDPSTFTFKGC